MPDELKIVPVLGPDGTITYKEVPVPPPPPKKEKKGFDVLSFLHSQREVAAEALAKKAKEGHTDSLKLLFTMTGDLKKDEGDGDKVDAAKLTRNALSVLKDLEKDGLITVNKECLNSTKTPPNKNGSSASSPPSTSPATT